MPWLTKFLPLPEKIVVLIKVPCYCDLGLTYSSRTPLKHPALATGLLEIWKGTRSRWSEKITEEVSMLKVVRCLYENVTEKPHKLYKLHILARIK